MTSQKGTRFIHLNREISLSGPPTPHPISKT